MNGYKGEIPSKHHLNSKVERSQIKEDICTPDEQVHKINSIILEVSKMNHKFKIGKKLETTFKNGMIRNAKLYTIS